MEWTNQQQLPAENEQEFMCNRDDCSECFVSFLSFHVVASSCSFFFFSLSLCYDVLLHLLFIEYIAPIHQTLANVCVNGFKMKILMQICADEEVVNHGRKKIKKIWTKSFCNMLKVFHDFSRWYIFAKSDSSCFELTLFRFFSGGSWPNRVY